MDQSSWDLIHFFVVLRPSCSVEKGFVEKRCFATEIVISRALTAARSRWTKELEMTLPEMVFGDSVLEVKNEELGFKYSFNAYDALRACGKEAGIKVYCCGLCFPLVILKHANSRERAIPNRFLAGRPCKTDVNLLQVSMSQNWMKNAEQDIPDAQPFDWTYSTPYRGTAASLVDGRPVDPVDTSERIDFESLKVRVVHTQGGSAVCEGSLPSCLSRACSQFWHACMLPVLAMPLLCVDSFSAFTWSAPAYKKCAVRVPFPWTFDPFP